MNELIKVNYDNADRPTVSGRELHEALEVKTAYKDWFPRMCEYGFSEGVDFCSFLSESTGGRPAAKAMVSDTIRAIMGGVASQKLEEHFQKGQTEYAE